ncbi:uncharacterized protein DSM5745_00073 [Aspergillus mulundensis]|uniref:Uncharacterized protein n=1 Tax=Aspergillus mulundensis TaxID=1810919 RepID=A0A3D8T2T4_9EURO|nr:hypothetical protein DSM5745_00073 [Aspergillus mulundensis]RDW92751.1 hypothetical protein DSM5745_00073 [Aspergillus mulundensis]
MVRRLMHKKDIASSKNAPRKAAVAASSPHAHHAAGSRGPRDHHAAPQGRTSGPGAARSARLRYAQSHGACTAHVPVYNLEPYAVRSSGTGPCRPTCRASRRHPLAHLRYCDGLGYNLPPRENLRGPRGRGPPHGQAAIHRDRCGARPAAIQQAGDLAAGWSRGSRGP